MLFIRLLASSCQTFFTVWVIGDFKSWIYWTAAWSYLQVHLYSSYRIHTGGQAQTVITKKSWMFKISLSHANGFVGKKASINHLTKQTLTSTRCLLRHIGGFLQIREEFSYLKIFSVSHRPLSHRDTLRALQIPLEVQKAMERRYPPGFTWILGVQQEQWATLQEVWHPPRATTAGRQGYHVLCTKPYYPVGTSVFWGLMCNKSCPLPNKHTRKMLSCLHILPLLFSEVSFPVLLGFCHLYPILNFQKHWWLMLKTAPNNECPLVVWVSLSVSSNLWTTMTRLACRCLQVCDLSGCPDVIMKMGFELWK